MQLRNPIKIPRLLGILNVTPDSFSDAGKNFESANAETCALEMIAQGAEGVDIGGDSTRPGSACVGITEELRRVEKLVTTLAPQMKVSVDTHQAAVAERCLAAGAYMINDVSAGSDREMLRLIAASNARIVLMFMIYRGPHDFSDPVTTFSLEAVHRGLESCVERALSCGVRKEQIILDTGMGAFLSPHAADSWMILSEYHRFVELGFELLLGCSRKGFLKFKSQTSMSDLDHLSALALVKARFSSGGVAPDWARVHNVSIHKAFLDAASAQ